MNVIPTENTVEQFDYTADFYIDAEGNRVEIPFDSDGETTSKVTAFIAEDVADHPVTVH